MFASQSEVIRAIVSGYSPCCGVPHRVAGVVRDLADVVQVARRHEDRRPVAEPEVGRAPVVEARGRLREHPDFPARVLLVAREVPERDLAIGG